MVGLIIETELLDLYNTLFMVKTFAQHVEEQICMSMIKDDLILNETQC